MKVPRLILSAATTAGLAVPVVGAASAVGAAQTCSAITVRVPATHLVYRWHRVDGHRQHVWRREIRRVHRHRVVRLVPEKVRVAYDRLVTEQSCTDTMTSPTPTTTTAPVLTTVRASIDPSFTLAVATPQAPPVPVTFTYSATSGSTVPDGTLSLSIYVHSSVSSAGGCQANVGGSVTSATCTVSVPAWGQYDLVTSYSGGVGVSATGQTETVDIEPPALSPVTINDTWGTTAPSTAPTATIVVSGSTAQVDVADANWEGATSVTLTDQLGDSCSATISGTTATCSMTVTGTPSSLTVAYPGGTSTQATQTVSPWGIPQSQSVTYAWPARSVTISNPSVTVHAAQVLWETASISGVFSWDPTNGHGSFPLPPEPISATVGQTLRFSTSTTGNVSGDSSPLGTMDDVITGPSHTAVNETGAPGSADCSAMSNMMSEANGYCALTFNAAGTYTITPKYVSADLNYPGGATGSTVTVQVS